MADYQRTSSTVPVRTTVVDEAVGGPSGWVVLQRLVGLIFTIAQALIILRIVLLLLVANQGNGIVSAIIVATDVLVDPFRAMFRLDRVVAGSGSMLDVAAIVALVGWTLLEAVIIAGLRIGDRRVETV